MPGQSAAEAPCSEEHQVQLLKKQLQQQEQQALAASSQVLMPFCHIIHLIYGPRLLNFEAGVAHRPFSLLICLSLMVKRCTQTPVTSAPIVSLLVVSVVAIVTLRATVAS